MKGTVIYHAPVGDLQVDWEDGAITALLALEKAHRR